MFSSGIEEGSGSPAGAFLKASLSKMVFGWTTSFDRSACASEEFSREFASVSHACLLPKSKEL